MHRNTKNKVKQRRSNAYYEKNTVTDEKIGVKAEFPYNITIQSDYKVNKYKI